MNELSRPSRRRCRVGWIRPLLGIVVLSAGVAGLTPAAFAESGFALVAEMQPLESIVAQPRRVREALKDDPEGQRGLARLEAWTHAEWSRIRGVDLASLSRFHVEQTVGFELPAEPGELTGRVIGRDESTGRWSLELRGPRLPARYDIVHRYLYLYASFDSATGQLDDQTVTIRGWVLE